MASSAVQLSFEINSNLIICLTESGTMARWVSRFRPKAFILAVGYLLIFEKFLHNFNRSHDGVMKGLAICRGIVNLHVPEKCKEINSMNAVGMDMLTEYAIKSGKEQNYCKKGDQVILLQGFFKETPDKEHYILKIMKVF